MSVRVLPCAVSTHLPTTWTMTSTSQRPKGPDVFLPTLDAFIQVLSLAKDTCGIPPAQIAFGSACILLTMIRARPPPFTPRRRTSDSRLFRTPWPTIRTMLTLGGIVLTCVKYSTGG